MLQQSPARVAPSDLDWRLLAPLLVNAVMVQMVVGILRVVTSYRTIELGLPVEWLGVISASFALLPAFSAVALGRFIDRGNDSQAAWIGTGLILLAAVGLWAWSPTALHLLAFTVVLGFGHMFCMMAQQMLAVRSATTNGREIAFGHFMVAASTGQGLGPLVVGWLGGTATVPATGNLFAIGFVAAALSFALVFMLRPASRPSAHVGEGAVVAVSTLVRMPGMLAVITASVVTVTALDLLTIYLPIVGAERHIDASNIGILLGIRAIAALVARAFFSRLIVAFGRQRLTLASIAIGAAAFVALAVPSLPVMYLAVTVVGLGLGIASTTTLSSIVDLAPEEARGTALSLRITGNRVGQVLVPFLSGLVAAVTGTGGVLVVIGLSLAASGAAIRLSSRPA